MKTYQTHFTPKTLIISGGVKKNYHCPLNYDVH